MIKLPLTLFINITDVPIKRRNKNPIAPDSNAMKSFFDMTCDVCETQLSSLQHAKLHYLEEHNIHDGYIKVRKFVNTLPKYIDDIPNIFFLQF